MSALASAVWSYRLSAIKVLLLHYILRVPFNWGMRLQGKSSTWCSNKKILNVPRERV